MNSALQDFLGSAFNAGLIIVGAALGLGTLGLYSGLHQLGANRVLAGLTALSMSCVGFSMAMAGIFPLPDPLHYGFNLILVGFLTPVLGAFALRGVSGTSRAQIVIIAGFAGLAAIYAVMLTSGLLTPSNQGLWVRAVALIAFSTNAYLCLTILRRM